MFTVGQHCVCKTLYHYPGSTTVLDAHKDGAHGSCSQFCKTEKENVSIRWTHMNGHFQSEKQTDDTKSRGEIRLAEEALGQLAGASVLSDSE